MPFNFSQTVTVGGVSVNVSNMTIRESEVDPITEIGFDFDTFANNGAQNAAVVQAAPVVVTQNGDGRTETFYGSITSIQDAKFGVRRVKRIKAAGQAEELNRRRFTVAFNNQTATQAVNNLMALDHGTSFTTGGVASNTSFVGDIILREETVADGLQRVAQISGWHWRIDNGVLFFEDPNTRPAPFDVGSLDNLVGSTLQLDEDISTVNNVIRAEAYEYRTIVVQEVVPGCTQRVFGEELGEEWELATEAEITAPPSLTNVSARANPQTGEIVFGTPLLLNDDKSINIDVRVTYTVRRLGLAEATDDTSIGLFGERHGQLMPSDGGADIPTALERAKAVLRRTAFPLVKARFACDELGLRAGQTVDLVTTDPNQILSLRVVSLQHTTTGAELGINVELSSEAFLGGNVVPEFARRIENLEKQGRNANSYAVKVQEDIGNILEGDTLQDSLQIQDVVTFAIAATGLVEGGGDLISTVAILPTRQGVLSGGGNLITTVGIILERTSTLSGGGDIINDAHAVTTLNIIEDRI